MGLVVGGVCGLVMQVVLSRKLMSFLTLYHFATKVWVFFIVYSVVFLFFINFLPILQAIFSFFFIHMHIHLTPFCPKAHIQTHLHKRTVFNLTSTPPHHIEEQKNHPTPFFHTPTNIILLYMYVCLSVCLSFDKTLAWACLTVKVCSFHLYTYSFVVVVVVVVVVIVLLLLLLLMLVFTTTCHLYHKSNAKLLLHLDARYNENGQCLTFDNSCLLFTVHIIRLLIKQMIHNSKHNRDSSDAIVKILESLKILSWN